MLASLRLAVSRPKLLLPGLLLAVMILSTVIAGGGLVAPAQAGTPLGATLSRTTFTVAGDGSDVGEIHYWSNAPLDTPDAGVANVVVVVHGDSRNADDYGRYVVEAAESAGTLGSTVVVAPQFGTEDDGPDGLDLRWTSASWKRGGPSATADGTPSISSFQVMDRVLVAARHAYPTARISLVGHSAGGQFVQRYAALSDQSVVQRYLVMNPGSYMYLDSRRWFGKKLRRLSTSERSDCPDYNEFKYGLEDRRLDIARLTDEEVRAHYAGAPVSYLLGELDTHRDSSLDSGCEANLQGSNRKIRGNQFFRALGRTVTSVHTKYVVAGVAHEGREMIASAAARALMFG